MTALTAPPDRAADPDARRVATAACAGVVLTLLVLVLSFALPPLLGWDVMARRPQPGEQTIPPLHGFVEVKLFGPGTVPTLLVALVGFLHLPRLAERLGWRPLLATSYVVGLAWLLALAYVDGSDGIGRVQDFPTEYLGEAREVDDVGAMLDDYVARTPYESDDNWVAHVAGHPPAALLFFVVLVRLGLDSSWSVGLAVTVVAALGVPGVLVTLRALGAEDPARRALPFLVLTPAAVFMAVSADAVFATVTSWGLACLALGATAGSARRVAGWSLLAGTLLGLGVMLSYGLPLMGLPALAVLAAARSWRPLPWAVGAALAVVGVFAVFGFAWWEAYPVLVDRYWDSIAKDRPQTYWVWGNLGALLVSAGPVVGVGLACLWPWRDRVRDRARTAGPERAVVLLALASATALLLADLSRMSKSETERIWLPFMPWLVLTVVLMPPRWRAPALGVQVATAVAVQHLLWTHW